MFESFKFQPAHQPDPEKPVEFELKPLDNETFYQLARSLGNDGSPSWNDCVTVLRKNVCGWSGLDQAYSHSSKMGLILGKANKDIVAWLAQCALELYRQVELPESERKNS